jgi:hypothetical protein
VQLSGNGIDLQLQPAFVVDPQDHV